MEVKEKKEPHVSSLTVSGRASRVSLAQVQNQKIQEVDFESESSYDRDAAHSGAGNQSVESLNPALAQENDFTLSLFKIKRHMFTFEKVIPVG